MPDSDVLAADAVPQPGHNQQKGCVGDGKTRAANGSGLCGVDGEDCENADLNEYKSPRPTIVATVEFQIRRTLCPCDICQREDEGEIDQPSNRDLPGEPKSCLSDDRRVNEVMQEFEWADAAVGYRFAMRTWRPPKPGLESA